MISNNGNDVEHGEDPLESPRSSDGNGRSRMMGLKISEKQFPLILVMATSFILMIAVVTWEKGMKSYGYSLSIPIVSLVISIGCILLTVFMESLYTQYGAHIVHVLFIWNFTGACFLTFSDPFVTTGNGYFAAWGCVATSAMAMGFTGDAFRSKIEGLGSLMGLGAFSGIVIIALVEFVGKGSSDRNESIYGMVVSVFTIALIMAIMYGQKNGGLSWFVKAKFVSLAVSAILWLVLACLCTFRGPFNTTGNGYFASWGGAACAAFAAFSAFTEMGLSTEDVVGFLAPANTADGPTGLSATIS